MIYTFKCGCGCSQVFDRSISVGPPAAPMCSYCGARTERDWQTDAPMIDTSGCRDHSEVRADKQVRSAWDGHRSSEAVEASFQRHIEKRRAEIRDAGGQRGSVKQTHAVPAHLFHGKIKETGDKNYWSDPANLNKHKECKVE